MNKSVSTDSFRKQQELRQRQRIARMRRRRQKIRRIKRLFRTTCVLVCLGGFMLAGHSVVKRNTSLPLPLKEEPTRQKTVEKKVTKPKVYDKSEINNSIETLAHSSNKYQKIYEHMERYPEGLLLGLCNNEEMLDFVYHYPGDTVKEECKFSQKELKEEFPLLIQWDKRWGYESYGNSCIGISGCAPTCLSMVVLALTGDKDATPKKMAQFAAENGYYVEGSGTQWSFLTQGAEQFGIHARELCLSESHIQAELENGHPIICSMGPGDFTTQGHFIVLVGNQNGKIIVNDPNSRGRSNLLWDYNKLESQIKNLWVYTS